MKTISTRRVGKGFRILTTAAAIPVMAGTVMIFSENRTTMAQEPANTPPNYDVTAEEFDRLRQDGTAESMAMFLARNPDHPLAAEALALLRSGRLSRGASSRQKPDSEVYRGFAAAVAANTATAYDSFAARYGNHPLAALARRLKQKI